VYEACQINKVSKIKKLEWEILKMLNSSDEEMGIALCEWLQM
jgi:hypothetical protein